MKRNNFWRWIFVVFVVVWALVEMYPPTDRPLIEVFEESATNRDDRFEAIVKEARDGVAAGIPSQYQLLLTAAANTSLTNYFPQYKPDPDANANAHVLNRIQRKAAGKIRLGIDLKGGTSFRLGMDLDDLRPAETPDATNGAAADAVMLSFEREAALSQAVEVLRRRVDRLGVAEPVIQPVGENQIIVQLPGLGVAEMESARRQVQQAAFLEFRLVHERSDELLDEGLIEPGYERMVETSISRTGERSYTEMLVSRRRASGVIDGQRIELSGIHVQNARVDREQFTSRPQIALAFNAEGAQLFGQITTDNVNRRMAIILDGKLASAPNINEPILGGRAQISGSYTEKEAFELANVLQNPLQAPLQLLGESQVDPSLGAETIARGVRAALLGLILVCVFMLVYYVVGGAIANAALALNMIILLGVMSSLQATFTLPGIAGIVLTIGMAVDANVLIFERIREELRAGKSLRGSITAGYDRAFSTIFDANITTLIASVILIFMGTGAIKGFGVTLSIGIAASMFSALVFTRLLFDWLLDKRILKKLSMMSLVNDTKIDFLKLAKPAFIAAWVLIIVGVSYGVFVRGGDVLNHEFKGGVEVSFQFNSDARIDQDQVSATVAQAVGGQPTVQYQRDLATGGETLAVKSALINDPSLKEGDRIDRTTELLVNSLKEAYPAAGLQVLNTERSGPSLGAEIQRSALISVMLALFGILIYVAFRYEFSFAVAAVVAVIHDVLMTLGIYFLFGHQMSAPMVAALLTIIGFSINDTIVIFDRIREDLLLGKRGSFKDLINLALNETLSRTIITSGTTFLATLALYLFGGGGLNDFSFTFLIGIVSGTFSTIYIASAFVLWWHKGQRPTLVAPTQPGVGEAPATA